MVCVRGKAWMLAPLLWVVDNPFFLLCGFFFFSFLFFSILVSGPTNCTSGADPLCFLSLIGMESERAPFEGGQMFEIAIDGAAVNAPVACRD